MVMRILVVGGGGREHALVFALARHGHEVLCAPGNPGIAALAACHPVKADDVRGVAALAGDAKVELVVVGPEAPLAAGLADAITGRGIPCFGPTARGARLEASKAWAKAFFARHGIPTADFSTCQTMDEVEAALARLGDRVVVKADGLAAGKGVVVCRDAGEARAAAEAMIVGDAHGPAGRRVVVERRLAGREASVMAVTDGARLVVLPTAEDHKALRDGDEGPNTGGMGVISPSPVVTPALLERVTREVLEPTVAGLRADGIDYRGVLYAGIMMDAAGTPNLLEYNCRFGDPEAEAILSRWEDDPAPWLLGAARGQLPPGAPRFSPRAAVCVVLAAAGYPGAPRAGDEIRGLDEAAALPDVIVYHAGTRVEGGRTVTAGGRVLAVTALGDDAAAARKRAYAAVDRIGWAGMQLRRDIGGRR
jgi:phosphoribosylamine--glycine ligase